jgi:hypothetical protein
MPDEPIAPYGPPSSVIALLQRHRRQGLPESLDKSFLERVGINEGVVNRTLQALRFLKLIDEEGNLTETLKEIKKLSDEDYQIQLTKILKESYRDVFEVIDLADISEKALINAFRHYEPSGQRTRMITLFAGLCKEAGLFDEGNIARSPVTKRPQPKDASRPTAPKTQPRRKVEENEAAQPSQQSHVEASSIFEESGFDQQAIETVLRMLLKQLPRDGTWTTKRRAQWLNAVMSNIDLLIEVSDDTEHLMIKSKIDD